MNANVYASMDQQSLIAQLERESANHYRAYIGLKRYPGYRQVAQDHLDESVNLTGWQTFIASLDNTQFAFWHYSFFGAAMPSVRPEPTVIQLSLC